MNLVLDRWLPVVLKDGGKDTLAPWEIVRLDKPPVFLDPPRPDFKAALSEFLIGLFQTAFPPAKKSEWKTLLQTPPSPSKMREVFASHAPFFELFGPRPRFMQDFSLEVSDDKKKLTGVAALLMDSPGENTFKKNGDFFIKEGRVQSLCPHCAAMALYTLQTFAPSGGQGHRTSLRGGGPLSTLIDMQHTDGTASTLWEKVWLNVVPLDADAQFKAVNVGDLPGKVYPWAAPTRTSEKGEETHPEQVHWMQSYWGMPRRIVLLEETPEKDEMCSLCGASLHTAVRQYVTRPYGTNYSGYWRHLLTPYREQKDRLLLSLKGSAHVTGYGSWLGVVYGQGENGGAGKKSGSTVVPAYSVQNARKNFLYRAESLHVDVAGYDMDNMKARQWCESVFPLYKIEEEKLAEFQADVEGLVLSTEETRKILGILLRDALISTYRKKQVKLESSTLADAQRLLWDRTEAEFYESAKKLAVGSEKISEEIREKWCRFLMRQAMRLFDEFTSSGRAVAEQLKQISEARAKLLPYINKKVSKILELPLKRGEK